LSAIVGGFSGNGSIYLGTGNDTLTGFGTGNFYGGTGTDKFLLGEGIYAISGSTIDSGGASMNASQFEQIGGVDDGIFSYSDGIVIVNADGVASFA
jgi:Ca2+-binding RTX toxin-like protein